MNDLLTTLQNIPLCRDYPTRKCRGNDCACEMITQAITQLQANHSLHALHALLLALILMVGTLSYLLANVPALPSPEPLALLDLPLAPLALVDLPVTQPEPVAVATTPTRPRPRPARHYDQNTMNLPCRTSVDYGICNR